MSAVIDSNVTTLLAAGLLFFFATGPVKGFGVTLCVGVLASMVTVGSSSRGSSPTSPSPAPSCAGAPP